MSKLQTPPAKYTSGWLDDLDGRTGLAQVMRSRFKAFTDDLGSVDTLSYMQISLVERSLWLEYFLKEAEKDLGAGNKFDVGQWIQAANCLQGILNKLGLSRIPRDVTNLQDYLDQQEEAA